MNLGNRLFRSVLLAVAGNPLSESLALKYGFRLGAKQFVAGTTREEALHQVRELNRRGILATLDHLGEGVSSLSEAAESKTEYLALLEAIHSSGIQSHVSLKPTQMGCALDLDTAFAHIREIVDLAHQQHNFVRIDMEDSPYTQRTLDLTRRLQAEGYTNVGTVIQAYLYRSPADVDSLTEEGINLRLVKGAYQEPASIAFPRKSDVDAHFKQMIISRLRSGVYTAIATHDEPLIRDLCQLVRQEQIPLTSFEFQMLYGIRSTLLAQLTAEGYKTRCYVPYGRHWYPYFVRRLAERPANALFVGRNLIRR